jgi:hypothetical protein
VNDVGVTQEAKPERIETDDHAEREKARPIETLEATEGKDSVIRAMAWLLQSEPQFLLTRQATSTSCRSLKCIGLSKGQKRRLWMMVFPILEEDKAASGGDGIVNPRLVHQALPDLTGKRLRTIQSQVLKPNDVRSFVPIAQLKLTNQHRRTIAFRTSASRPNAP